jgi:hypothetical protein
MGLFGIGDDNRMVIDVPVRYAPILGLPYDPDDPSVFERSGKKINIVVSKGKGKAKEREDAVDQLMEYGIPFQAAKSLVGEDYEILDNKNDPGWNDWRLEDSSPEDVAAGRGREKSLRGIDVAPGVEYGATGPVSPFWDLEATPFKQQTVTGEQVAEIAADPFSVNVSGDESKSVKDAIAAMKQEEQRQLQAYVQEQAEKQAAEELARRQEAEQVTADEAQRQVQEQRNRVRQEQEQQQKRDAELRAQFEAMRDADPNRFAGEEGLGGERSVDPVTGEVRESDAGGQVTERGVIGTPAQSIEQALEAQRGDWEAALAELRSERQPIVHEQPDLGDFTPFDVEEGSTSIEEMLNIFNQDPERYYTTETVIGPDGQAITQQVLSPIAQAALQAFSTQRGAEAMETGSRFGAGSPFGVIAGTGGTAQQAIDLAKQQAYSGITSPFAALQTGGGIGDISQILRGGLSTQQQSDLAGLQARGGLGVEDQFALAGMQARGGLSPQQMQALAGLQARGGLTPQQRYEEQRLAMMPSLLQMSPQSLGGFAEVFGGGATGKEALQGYLSPFFTQPDFTAQGAAPATDWRAQQALPQSGVTGTPQPWYEAEEDRGIPGEPGYRQQVAMPGYVSDTGYDPPTDRASIQRPRTDRLGMPVMGLPSTPSRQRNNPDIGQNISSFFRPTSAGSARQQAPATRQTLGGYGKATPFARGGTQAKAAIAGKDLEDYLGEVTPSGGTARRGGFGSSVSNRFTY